MCLYKDAGVLEAKLPKLSAVELQNLNPKIEVCNGSSASKWHPAPEAIGLEHEWLSTLDTV